MNTEQPTLRFEPIKMNWQAATSILLLTLELGTEQGKQTAKVELMRMAKLADLYCEASLSIKEQHNG